MTDFIDQMDQLAAEIAKGAREAATDLDIKIDAFKALVPYYVQKMKGLGKDDPDDGLPNFGNFADRITTAENHDGSDEPGLRDSRRNGN